MEEENPYRSPRAQLVESTPVDGELASRFSRLVAIVLDTIIVFAITGPMAYFGGYFEQVRANSAAGRMFMPIGTLAFWTAIGFTAFALIQAYPLHAYGQTWGKRICKIRIVDMDGAKPSLGRLLLRRYLPINLASVVPILGNVFGIVDVLMIFRRDKRCLHDLIAGTRVIKSS
ncbi:RDD family protein [Lysobacter sp. Root983]|uniref:RDD family protein n=1 Tax=Lysobacter sp. Root983 TaxID=1736613 RepID=UPI0007108ED4|nr:RDD family protein [Lysobacter sp. Root983]